jgi:hypothetical protein
MGDGKKARGRTKRAKVPPKPGAASARARVERDERVDVVVKLLAEGEWRGLRSTKELATMWGVHMDTVSDYAREASTVVRRVVQGDPEAIKTAILAGIEHVGQLALKTVKVEKVGRDEYEERPAPSLDAALRASELRLKTLGLMPEHLKVEVVEPTDAEMTSRAIEWLNAQGYRVTKGAK